MKQHTVLCVGFILAMITGLYASPDASWANNAKGATTMEQGELQKAQTVLAKHEAMLMDVPGVVGVGVGTTEEGKHAAIHVYVNVKASGGTIPPAIPQQLDSVPVRVIKTDEIRAR